MSSTCIDVPQPNAELTCAPWRTDAELRLSWLNRRASHLRKLFDKDLTEAVLDAHRLTTALGVPVELVFDQLAGVDGRQDALLIPLVRTGGFRIVVDSQVTPAGAASGRADRSLTASLVAHEIGHLQFYSAGRPPRRRVPWIPEEEGLCDTFARRLLEG